MIDIEQYIQDKPGHPVNEDEAECVRAAFNSLNAAFTTRHSRIESVDVDEENLCLSIVFVTPYLATDPDSGEHLANVFRLADSVSISAVPDEDGFSAAVILTFALWD